MSRPPDFGFSKGEKNAQVLSTKEMTAAPLGLTASQADPLSKIPFGEGFLGSRWRQLPAPRWVWWAAVVAAVVGWGVADIRLRGLPWPDRPLEHKTDFTVYTAAGRAFFTGENPYEVTNLRGWKYLYPPLFALLVAPLSLLPMSEQCLVWYFISVVLCWGCYRELARIITGFRLQESRLAKIPPHWWKWLGGLAVAAALFPTLNCLQRGQVGVLKLYLLLLGVRLVWLSAGWVGQSLGGLALAGAIALKLTPALAVGMVLWAQLADLATQVWRKWQSREKGKNREESTRGKTVFQPPHFAHIRPPREPNTSHWPLDDFSRTPRDHSSDTGSFHEHPSEKTVPFHASIGVPSPQPKKIGGDRPSEGGDRSSEGPVGSNREVDQQYRVALAARSFWATGLGMAAGLALFFFLLPSLIIGWQKNLDHLAYWADRVFSSAGEGFAMEKAASDGDSLNDPPKPIPANYRTVRNQSLANAMFRLAAFVDFLVLGGPDDRQLDYEATAPNRISSPLYQTIQKAARVILLVALVLAGGILGVVGGRLGQAAAFGLGCVGILAISPVSWGHYFMLLAPGALFTPLWLLDRDRPAAAGWLAGAPALLSILHYVLLNPLGRMGLLGLGTAGWLLAACILVLWSSLQHRRGLEMVGSAAQTAVCMGTPDASHPQSPSASEQTRSTAKPSRK